MATLTWKDVWRSASTRLGAPSVTAAGVPLMPRWLAGALDSHTKVCLS